MNATHKNMIDKEELSLEPIFDSAETMSAIPLKSVEVNEVTPVKDYWSELEETFEVSLHKSNIIIA
ncbi:hypothetical protein Sjap_003243 [Stephania japonica]|uniref:Uncharacterized protein n=1 Tax=Stephania japonica TaxID=461633 RepID=A0AAP0KPY4_9MAGN